MQMQMASLELSANELDAAMLRLAPVVPELQETLGADRPSSLAAVNQLANAMMVAEQLDKAIELLASTEQQCASSLGAHHPRTLVVTMNLAVARCRANQHVLAVPQLEEAITLMRKVLGRCHPHTLSGTRHLVDAYLHMNWGDAANPLLEELYNAQMLSLAPDHSQLLTDMRHYTDSLLLSGAVDNVIAVYQRLHDAQSERFGLVDLRTIETTLRIAEANPLKGDDANAQKMLEDIQDLLGENEERLATDPQRFSATMDAVAADLYRVNVRKDDEDHASSALKNLLKNLTTSNDASQTLSDLAAEQFNAGLFERVRVAG